MCLIGRDELRNSASVHQYLEYRAAAMAIRGLAQDLGHNGLQAHRQESLGLLAQFARQGVDYSVDRLDRASRVLIPRKLREHAGIKEDAVLVGMYDRLEIWGGDVWLTHLSQLEDEHEMSLGKVLQMPSIKPSFPGEQSRL